MKIAAVQLKPVKADIRANIKIQLQWALSAKEYGAHAIFFPELSLTGYDSKMAGRWAIDEADNVLDPFQKLSEDHNLLIATSIPTKGLNGTLITMMIFQPGIERERYSKQLLHEDELPYFIAGDKEVILDFMGQRIAPAICYESLQPSHNSKAIQQGATLYIASVAKSAKGVDNAYIHFPDFAKDSGIPVIMSNSLGPCDDFISVGRSAAWTREGKLSGNLDDTNEGLLIFDTETEKSTFI
jgi:predicted amidohydrolase